MISHQSMSSLVRLYRHTLFTLLLTATIVVFSSCSSIKSITEALSTLQRCEFRMSGIREAKLAGVPIGDKRSIGDFRPFSDGITLLQAYRNNQFDLELVADVEVRNPNTGNNGTRKTDAVISHIDARLLIDEKQTAVADIVNPLTVPSTGESVIVPVRVRIDVLAFYREKGYDDVLSFLLGIAGAEAKKGRIALDIQPTVETPLGRMKYPQRIRLIDKEFRSE